MQKRTLASFSFLFWNEDPLCLHRKSIAAESADTKLGFNLEICQRTVGTRINYCRACHLQTSSTDWPMNSGLQAACTIIIYYRVILRHATCFFAKPTEWSPRRIERSSMQRILATTVIVGYVHILPVNALVHS